MNTLMDKSVPQYKYWDTKNNKWLSNTNGEFLLRPDGSLLFYNNETKECKDISDFETVEYTGSCDKNGAPIYFGDRVILPDGNIGTVTWNEHKLAFDVTISDFSYDYLHNLASKSTVWGNIFEHPKKNLSHE